MTVTKYILSIDPGKSTGVALLSYDDTSVPELVQAWQFDGGAEELHEWVCDWFETTAWGDSQATRFIVEKFNARNTGGFSYTTASLEPLRCEGVLVAHDLPDEYVQPAQQYIAGGTGKADKKKRQHRMLKDLGFYRTGKDLDAPDADDFRSACAHALSWLMRTGHKMTYDMISDWNERNA